MDGVVPRPRAELGRGPASVPCEAFAHGASTERGPPLGRPILQPGEAGAADKVINALARKGLVEPVTASPGMPVWRESGDGRHVALRITAAGLKAFGFEPHSPAADRAPAEQPAPRGL